MSARHLSRLRNDGLGSSHDAEEDEEEDEEDDHDANVRSARPTFQVSRLNVNQGSHIANVMANHVGFRSSLTTVARRRRTTTTTRMTRARRRMRRARVRSEERTMKGRQSSQWKQKISSQHPVHRPMHLQRGACLCVSAARFTSSAD
jgi:hypothetical protein